MEDVLPTQKLTDHPGAGFEIYRPKNHKIKGWGLTTLGGIMVALVSLFSVLIILNGYTAVLRHGRAALLNRIIPLLPLILLGITLGLLMILWAKNHWDDQLILQERELIQYTGKKKRVWSYEDTRRLDTVITNINFGGSIVGTRVKLCLDGGDQQKWVIRNRYENMPDLIESIRCRILPYVYKKALQKLARNEKVAFHPGLNATRKGIDVDENHLSWDDIPDPVIKNNRLILKGPKDQEPLMISKVRKIKNLDLLLCLLDNPPIFED